MAGLRSNSQCNISVNGVHSTNVYWLASQMSQDIKKRLQGSNPKKDLEYLSLQRHTVCRVNVCVCVCVRCRCIWCIRMGNSFWYLSNHLSFRLNWSRLTLVDLIQPDSLVFPNRLSEHSPDKVFNQCKPTFCNQGYLACEPNQIRSCSIISTLN